VTANKGAAATRSVADLRIASKRNYLWPMVGRHEVDADKPLILAEGDGVRVRTIEGDEYIDLMSTTSRASTLGYSQERIARAVYEQLGRLHYGGTAGSQADVTIELAARLAELAPGDLSFTVFVGSGSEANEVAFKLARLYHRAHGRKPRAYKVISRASEYHGAVAGAMAASDWLGVRLPFEPGLPGFSRVPAPTCYRPPFALESEELGSLCADLLEREILQEGPELVAAFILEPVMQANGVQIPPRGYMERIREICTNYDVLLIADEVITAFGRVGEWFGMQHWGIEPDIMTMAKALTAGFIPLGATMVTAEIAEALPVFPDIHTYGGHPAAAVAALTALDIYGSEDLIARARVQGRSLLAMLERFRDIDIVGDVRGIGMWAAVDFTSDRSTRAVPDPKLLRDIVLRARELGVIVSSNGTCIEVAPPLVIADDTLEDGIARFESAVREMEQRALRGIRRR
jgi:adenosylmethionine-8-amino-7-oxononanoate aminotransferase